MSWFLRGVRGAVRPGVLVTGGVALSAVVVVIAAVVAPPSSGTCDVNATTANFTTQLAATAAGQTLCLASGSYGTYTGTSGNKSSPGVTIKEQSGATASLAPQFRSTPVASWLIFDGIDLAGCELSGPANNITFKNAVMPGYCQINAGAGPGANNACSSCPAMNNNAIVFDNMDFTLASCPTGSCLGAEGRMSFTYGAATPAGVTIKNSRFTGNCGDGVQFTGNSNAGRGVLIQNNTFQNLRQGACAPHVDSMQFVDGCCVVVTGNYFVNNSSGFVGYDGAANNTVFTNNVVNQGVDEGPAYCIGGGVGGTVEHNIFRSPASLYLCVNHDNAASTGVTWRNNIQNGAPTIQGASSYGVNNYNLCTSGTCAGANSLNGTPAFVGGASPTSWAGFALSPGSLGKGAASDGTDIGVNP